MPKLIKAYCHHTQLFHVDSDAIVTYGFVVATKYVNSEIDDCIYVLEIANNAKIKDLILFLKLKYNFHKIQIYVDEIQVY